jgi:hypothetical protein
MHKLREKLVKSLKEASEAQTKYYNQNHQPIRFRKNEIVLVSTKHLRLKSASRKISPRYISPYKIDQPIGAQAYRVHLPNSLRIHNVFHISILEPYQQRAGETQEILNNPELINNEEEYEVEEVLARKLRQGSY